MIVKYLNDGVWGYTDNIYQAGVRDIKPLDLVVQYDKEAKQGKRPKVDTELVNESQKAFIIAKELLETNVTNFFVCNMLNQQKVIENRPAKIILLYPDETEKHDSMILITNETVYLMNDKGQTIERLV